jgi:hypothetical protein
MSRIKRTINLNRLHLARVIEARSVYNDAESASFTSNATINPKNKEGAKNGHS